MKKNAIFSLCLTILISACATKSDNYQNVDKFENYNRTMFSFNYRFDKYVMKPLAKGYIAITSKDVRTRVSSAFSNILEPVSAANHVLQGEFAKSGTDMGRFVVNTTLGLAGTFDVATGWGLPKERSGFDDTLAKWCVADGPFIVLPFFGPSTPRAATGLLVDSAANPVTIGTTEMNNDGQANTIFYSYSALRTISLRADAMDLLDDLERNSVDFYATMRSAYLQNRAGKNCYGKQNTYDFNFDADGIIDEDETYQEMEQVNE